MLRFSHLWWYLNLIKRFLSKEFTSWQCSSSLEFFGANKTLMLYSIISYSLSLLGISFSKELVVRDWVLCLPSLSTDGWIKQLVVLTHLQELLTLLCHHSFFRWTEVEQNIGFKFITLFHLLQLLVVQLWPIQRAIHHRWGIVGWEFVVAWLLVSELLFLALDVSWASQITIEILKVKTWVFFFDALYVQIVIVLPEVSLWWHLEAARLIE